MSFESNLGSIAGNIISGIPDTPKRQSTGFRHNGNLIMRSKSDAGPRYDRKDWPELMALQEKERTSPLHIHKDYNVPVLTQERTNYCWCFGVCAGLMNRYAMMDGVAPLLSPAGPACQGKSFSNEGGWGEEAIGYINQYGVPTQDVWPNCSFNKDLPSRPSVIRSAGLHGVIQFEVLGSYDFDGVMSALLCPYNSSPVSIGYSWWGHLILGLQAVRYEGQWGIVFVNSWDYDWGDNGFGVLLGEKANPTEAVVIKSIKPRSI
jgi:hypothetical protein